MPSPLGFLDVGRDNLFWGHVAGRIENLMSPGGMQEHPAGWPVFTVVLFLGSAIYYAVQLLQTGMRTASPKVRVLRLIFAVCLASVILWAVGTRFINKAPIWRVLLRLAPGATAIRVPQRVDLVITIPLIVVSMLAFEKLTLATSGSRTRGYMFPGLLAVALIFEQLNSMPTHLISRSAEARKFSRVAPPPKMCSQFYVSTVNHHSQDLPAIQTDAMLVAQQFGIATVDGYSGWFPKDWNFLNATIQNTAEEAVRWARDHGTAQGLCSLNLKSGKWLPVDERHPTADQNADDLADSGFEEPDLSIWTLFQQVQATVTNVRAHSGLSSLAETDGGGSVYQDVTVEPMQTYVISAWISASPDATATAYLAAYDSGANTATFSRTLVPRDAWQHLEFSVRVSQAGTLRIHLFRDAGSGTIYWDDVRIYHVKAP
jgi:hypothetical protein